MIHNGPKQTISTSGGLELLQMVSEPDTGRCVSKNVMPPRGWIVRLELLRKVYFGSFFHYSKSQFCPAF